MKQIFVFRFCDVYRGFCCVAYFLRNTMGSTEQSSRNHFAGCLVAGCICLWFFKAVFAYTSCGMMTNTLAPDPLALTT